jgi:two-component system phosphate regulon sensor histidine kinase PhoR
MIFNNNKKTINGLKQRLDEMLTRVSELKKRNASMKAIIKGMVEAVVVVDSSTNILAVNHSAERIFDILKKDAEDRLLLEVIRSAEISDIVSRVLSDGVAFSKEIVLSWPVSGSFMVNGSPIIDAGQTTGCVLVIHDITDLRKLEAIRKDFIANVSHELKTPLTSIKCSIETLLGGAMDNKKDCEDFLKIAASHVDRLDSLINDLLSLSYLESSNVELKKENIHISKLTDGILAGFEVQLSKKSVKAKNQLPLGLIVLADKDKLSQVLANLVDNAIKFNRQNGSLNIYSQPQAGRIKIIVEDTGAGIPPKDIPRIFERFYRVDKARSRQLGGTGLGLSIVKHIVELHGGEVGVETTEGIGSKFWFTLSK